MATHTAHVPLGDLADQAVHAIRLLNHRTRPGISDLADPIDTAEIIAALTSMTGMLPQLLGQIAGWLEREQHEGRLRVDDLAPLPGPAQTVHALTDNLQHAIQCLQRTAVDLDTAHQHAAHLTGPRRGQNSCRSVGPGHLTKLNWVTQAKADGLAPRSIRKYHVFLSSVFVRAVKDRVLIYNPCDHTELPKVITAKARTLTPDEYERLLAALPQQHRLMIETLIEAGLRWGELIALKPRHIDFLRRTLVVEETIVEVSKKHSPTGQRYLAKPYPKDNEPRTFGVRQTWLDAIAEHIRVNGIGHDDLLFPTRAGTPISRNTFRTRIWLPAVKASGIDFPVRVHDLRHAHASWLLAGGADLMSVMERMGHSQIQTTQKYLHTLPDTDQRNLDALTRVQTRRDP